MTAEAWIAGLGVALAALGMGFAAWNSLRNEIRDSRHLMMNKMQTMLEGLETDIEAHDKRLGSLETRVAVLERVSGDK